jgi:hypothetical protein
VRLMARRATLPHGFMLEDKRPPLRHVAFAARVLLR